MANRKISTLPDTAVVADLIGTQLTVIDDLAVTKTKSVSLAILRRALFAGGTGYTDTDPITVGAVTLTGLGFVNAAAGTDTVATDGVVTAPLSRGAGAPAKISWLVGIRGGTGTGLQSTSEAWFVQEVANASAREIAAWNPAGPVMGLLAANVSVTLLANGDGARFGTRTRVIRVGGTPAYSGIRVNTSVSAPSQSLGGQDMVSLVGNAYTDTGTVVTIGQMSVFLRENATASAFGSALGFQVADIGAAAVKEVLHLRGGGTNVAELLSRQTTFRFIPATSGSFAWRNAANSADTFTLNEAGTTVTFPSVTAFVLGADPGGAQLLRVGGSLRASGAVTFDAGLSVSGAAFAATGNFAHLFGRNSNGATNVLALNNLDSTAVTLHQAALLWNMATTAGAAVNAGAIVLGKIAEWTSTASTQDSFMLHRIVIDGALATALTLTSSGGAHTATFPGGLTMSGIFRNTSTETQLGSTTGNGVIRLISQDTGTSALRFFRGTTADSGRRWSVGVDTVAESGGNAGTGLQLISSDDAGATIDVWLGVTRVAGGAIAFSSARPITAGTYNGNTLGSATVTFPSATAFVIGSDPGGSAVFRVGGGVRATGTFQTSATLITARAATNSFAEFVGSNATNVGGNLRLFGETHATQANDIELRSGTTVRLFYDDSALAWTSSVPFAVNGATPSSSTALITTAGTTAVSSLRIPHGAAPTAPVDGDMWTTTAGLFIRINGATVGPLS